MKQLHSLQWINDRMGQCRCRPALLNRSTQVRPAVEKLICGAGLTVVKRASHQFDRGYTAVWLFKQSHLSLHSWPEYNFVTLSLEVCSFKGDDTAKIRKLYAGLVKLFQPQKTSVRKYDHFFK